MPESITLPDASSRAIEAAWKYALEQELGLVVDVDTSHKVESIATMFYAARKDMLAVDPTLPLLDFYITLPRDRHALVIVRELKATLE